MEDVVFTGRSARFEECYQALSADSLPADTPHRSELVHGNKVVLPPSALDRLSRLNVVYPLMFAVSPYARGRAASGASPRTHCGVLEFSAPEGVVYLAPWMLRTLGLGPGDLVRVANVALPRGAFVRIEPQSVAFVEEITDARAVLERALRAFAALTAGDVLDIAYNGAVYGLRVLETGSGGSARATDAGTGGICILETDLQVDFAPPVGYVEPARPTDSQPTIAETAKVVAPPTTAPFTGVGHRLSGGSAVRAAPDASAPVGPQIVRAPRGGVFFAAVPPAPEAQGEPANAAPNPPQGDAPAFAPFSGKGRKLQ